jgi:acetyl-CoA acetyltransferase
LNLVFICDCIHSPIERFGVASRRAPVARNRGVDWNTVDDVMDGCANQAG